MNSIISTILAGVGISNKKQSEENRQNFIDNGKKIHDNFYEPLYSSNKINSFENYHWNLHENRFKSSFNKNNFIINDIYNTDMKNTKKNKINDNSSQDSTFSDDSLSVDSRYSDKKIANNNLEFFNNVANFNNDIRRKAKQSEIKAVHKIVKDRTEGNETNPKLNYHYGHKNYDDGKHESLLDYQFSSLRFSNPSNPVANNRVANDINQGSLKGQQAFEDFENNYSSVNKAGTYGVVDDSQLHHNNMVPFFKGKGAFGDDPTDYLHRDDQIQRKLDTFTGSLNNPEYRPKTERRPLFNPMVGLTNIYGSPVKTDDFEGRYIPSRERRNETPFQSVKVTPGLNLGYNTEGKQGFHDPYRAMFKTTNQLRTVNNPKVSYADPMGNVNADNQINAFHRYGGGSRPVDPNVFKRSPEKFEEYSVKDLLPKSFVTEAPPVNGYINPMTMGTDVRGTHVDNLHGPLGHSEASKTKAFNRKGMTPAATQRNQYNYNDVSNVVSDTKTVAYNRKNLTPAATQRDQYKYSDISNVVGDSKGIAFNKVNLTPDATQRNLYNYNDVSNVAGNVKATTYNREGLTPDPTLRNIHNYNELSNVVGGAFKGQSYNREGLTPNPTNRNMYNYNGVSNLSGGVLKGTAFNKEGLTPDPTLRNTYNYADVSNVNGGAFKGVAYDKVGLTPDPTLRNTYNYKDVSNVNGGAFKGVAYNKELMTPDATLRNTYNYKDVGHVAPSTGSKTYVYNKDLMTPDPTERDMHKYNDVGGAFMNMAHRAREDAKNSYVNVAKDELTIVKHSPTTCNYTKIPTFENTMVSLCDRIQINRDLFPDITQQITPGFNYPDTRSKQMVSNFELTQHHYQFPNDTLQNNPYVNNSQDVAIYDEGSFKSKIIGNPANVQLVKS